MTLDEIFQQITQGLSGDSATDIDYLNAQIKAYSDHPQSADITRMCSRMISERMPESERQAAFDRLLNEALRPMADDLEQARHLLQEGDYEQAKTVLEALTAKADDAEARGFFKNDAMSEYYCFSEPFEEILFMTRQKPSRKVRQAALPFADIYHSYGRALMETKAYEKAGDMLKKAMRYNPANAKLALDAAACANAQGDMEQMMEATRKAFKYAFHVDDLLQCYLNVGQYFMAQGQWAEAKGCILFGMEFDKESPAAQAALDTIAAEAGDVVSPVIEVMEALSAIHDFPLGADETIIGLAYQYGRLFAMQQNNDAARYFLHIAYELTQGEEIKLMLDKLG